MARTAPGWSHTTHYHPRLLAAVPDGCGDALDIGCGEGVFARQLAERCRRVTAIDRSPAMVARARAAGVAEDRIIVDAGLDLGKTPRQSLTLLRRSATLADLGPPLLLSASNKRFLGALLDLEIDERRAASHAAHALGIALGCRVVRVHDVQGAKRVAAVLEALLSTRLAHAALGSRNAEVGGA